MADIKYKYAYDEAGKLVSIEHLSKKTASLHKYKCVGCGNDILPRAIDSNCVRPHFYHKEQQQCSGETYLHELAKKIIKRKFDKSDSFNVSYNQLVSCSNLKCNIRDESCDNRQERRIVNLKKYYDKCELEQRVNTKNDYFIADLLLTKEGKADYPPMLIEICVFHPSEYKKINSGLQILELKIENENSIENFLNSEVITENHYDVLLYGINRAKQVPLTTQIKRFYHIPGESCSIKTIDCKKINNLLCDRSDLEINIYNKTSNEDLGYPISDRNTDLILYLGAINYIKECRLCEHCKSRQAFDIVDNKFVNKILYECELYLQQPKDNYECFKRATSEMTFFLNQINYNFEVIKDTREKKKTFRVAISASYSFINCEFAIEKCSHLLENKLKECNLIISSGAMNSIGGSSGFLIAIAVAEHFGVPLVGYQADREKDGNRAGYVMNSKVLNQADALIYFWNGMDNDPKYIVHEAHKRNIHVKIVNYGAEKKLCPVCGEMLQPKVGRYGVFYGCIMYPDCNGMRSNIE